MTAFPGCASSYPQHLWIWALTALSGTPLESSTDGVASEPGEPPKFRVGLGFAVRVSGQRL
jgi:hypothetical protein